MKIDGMPWRAYLWLWVKAVVFGGLFGAAAGGLFDRLVGWALGVGP